VVTRYGVGGVVTQGALKSDDDEFGVIRLTRAHMAANAEGEVVVVEHVDAVTVQHYDILDRGSSTTTVEAATKARFKSRVGVIRSLLKAIDFARAIDARSAWRDRPAT
jgi:hypothetical protein